MRTAGNESRPDLLPRGSPNPELESEAEPGSISGLLLTRDLTTSSPSVTCTDPAEWTGWDRLETSERAP